jgi:homoserine O-acetyltransferase
LKKSLVDQSRNKHAWFENYKFRDGESSPRLRIHYATLGTPHRNAQGDIDNAVLVLHWTGADGRALLSPTYMNALFDPGRPLDAHSYYLIFPDSVGHGQSSRPSDGLMAGFPNYGYGDIVDLQHKLVTETLGKHVHGCTPPLRFQFVTAGAGSVGQTQPRCIPLYWPFPPLSQ